MARRRRFRRISPDMGWYASPFLIDHANNGGIETTTMDELIAFPEIDGDEGIITKDKSDWFIKRVIVEGYCTFVPSTTNLQGQASARRIFDWSLCTMMASSAAEAVQNRWPVSEPDFWDNARRVLRTGTTPCYNEGLQLVEQASAGSSGALITEQLGSETVPRTHDISPWWGPAKIEFDIPVSSAGLVPDSSLYFGITTGDTVAPYPTRDAWDNTDSVYMRLMVRVLLQKRIG